MTVPAKIGVNFIAQNDNLMAQANIAHAAQFLPRPHAPHRIMGRTQQHELYLLLDDLALQIRKIHFIAAAAQQQRRINYSPPIVLDNLGEGIINRPLNQHRIARLGVSLHRHRQRKDHAGSFRQPFPLHLPGKMPGVPILHCGKISVTRFAVAKNSVTAAFLQGPRNFCGHREIHIRHPQGQHVRRTPPLHGKIIFQTIGITAVRHLVKIIYGHHAPR